MLFVGNSITRHSPKPDIGWFGDWGMAASAKERDYVHVAVKLLEERLGKMDYAIVNCAAWERQYYQDEILSNWAEARDFFADIVVIRIGENMHSAQDKFAAFPIAPHFAKMIEYFTPNPSAKVVVCSLFWRQPIIDEAIRAVAQQKGYTFVSLGDLGENVENTAAKKFAHEGVAMHPGDLGMQRIAERIVEKILEK